MTFTYLSENGAPWLRVVNGVDDDLVAEYAQKGDVLAVTVLNTECASHPTATVWFGAGLGLNDRQAHAVAHEMSHLVAKLLRRKDTTHAVDGGVA